MFGAPIPVECISLLSRVLRRSVFATIMVFRSRCTSIIINFDWSSDAVEAVSEPETELASASAISDNREEAIDDRLCDDLMNLYNVRYLGRHFG